MHPWHDLSLGPRSPRVARAVVEIPAGSRVKYELDLTTGMMKVDRLLRGAETYPADYGFFPRTLETDGDPLDVLILSSEPIASLTVCDVAPIGLLETSSKAGREAKILAVLRQDPLLEKVEDVDGLPSGLLDRLLEFLRNYKTLEGEPVRVLAKRGRREARAAILECARRYQREIGRPAPEA